MKLSMLVIMDVELAWYLSKILTIEEQVQSYSNIVEFGTWNYYNAVVI